ncbi:cytochrome P450 [Agrocybe pediades]|nr:cytochrome P450 [Agrocybe pediades]
MPHTLSGKQGLEFLGEMSLLVKASFTILVAFIISKALKYRRNQQTVSYLPGLRPAFFPMTIPGLVIPTTWWNPGIMFTWAWRFHLYKWFGSETISLVPFLSGPVALYTSNLDVARQVAGGSVTTNFVKPEQFSRSLLFFGMNLVAADGETWRTHRRLMAPSFNNDLYDLVWTETLKTYHEMIRSDGWDKESIIDQPVVQKITFKLALLIIGKCGFGFPFDWATPPISEDGTMSMQEALRIISDTNTYALFLPKWTHGLPFKKLKDMRTAHAQFRNFMHAQIATKKDRIHLQSAETVDDSADSDFFTTLVRANEGQGSKLKLSDDELIGNVFIMLFAGHETTAHTLAVALGYLAIYEEVQEEIYEQIVSVCGTENDPEISHYPKLDKVLAAFYEASRLFPSGFIMIREAHRDTTLQLPNPVGQEGHTTIPIPKGTQVIVDMIGVQYNPRYYEKPEEYRPSRWYGVGNESETFTAFSIGPRACLGRKFATTEAVCYLAMLLRDYTVRPILRPGESKEQWKERVLDAKVVMTLGVQDVPLRFTRRA